MAKKSAIYGEYIITILEDDSVTVNRIYKSTREALCTIAKAKDFPVSPKSTTQDLGRKLLAQYCDKAKEGAIGEYLIERESNNRINVIRTYTDSRLGLEDCAQTIGFPYEKDWTISHFGSVLVDYINNLKN